MTPREREIRNWAQGSAFAPGGMPATWFHGTDVDEPFNVFARWDEFSIGFHFGGLATATARLVSVHGDGEPEGCIMPVWCRARSPLRLPDLYTWKYSRLVGALEEAGVVKGEAADWLADACSDEAVFAAIEAAGHDCIVYSNECEAAGSHEDSLVVWRSELLKSPFAASFQPDDPRLSPQSPTPPWEIERHAQLSREIDLAREELGALSPACAKMTA